MTRSSRKPTATERMAPYFAAGWTGDMRDPVDCADCGLPAWLSLSPRAMASAQIAHVDATDQRWWDASREDNVSNVTITCRACNLDHPAHGATWLAPLVITTDHRRASRGWNADANQSRDAERERRRAARRARWGA